MIISPAVPGAQAAIPGGSEDTVLPWEGHHAGHMAPMEAAQKLDVGCVQRCQAIRQRHLQDW